MRTLSSLIAGYLETGEYEKQLSPDTIKAYRIDLRQFVDFTEGAWADKDMLNQYIKYLNQHFAPRSVKRKLASIRAFLSFFCDKPSPERSRTPLCPLDCLHFCRCHFAAENGEQDLTRLMISSPFFPAQSTVQAVPPFSLLRQQTHTLLLSTKWRFRLCIQPWD